MYFLILIFNEYNLYQILIGGFGYVFVAQDINTGKEYALKVTFAWSFNFIKIKVLHNFKYFAVNIYYLLIVEYEIFKIKFTHEPFNHFRGF